MLSPRASPHRTQAGHRHPHPTPSLPSCASCSHQCQSCEEGREKRQGSPSPYSSLSPGHTHPCSTTHCLLLGCGSSATPPPSSHVLNCRGCSGMQNAHIPHHPSLQPLTKPFLWGPPHSMCTNCPRTAPAPPAPLHPLSTSVLGYIGKRITSCCPHTTSARQ